MSRAGAAAIALALWALGAALPSAAADAPSWRIDPGGSRLAFTGVQMGTPFEGAFRRFDAAVRFDPDAPQASRIVVVIDMASAATGSAERDGALPGRDWFWVEKHPVARFESAEVAALGDGRFEARGALTLRGVTRAVALPFTFRPGEGGRAEVEGRVAINRLDYGVGQGAFAKGDVVGLEVAIGVKLAAVRE